MARATLSGRKDRARLDPAPPRPRRHGDRTITTATTNTTAVRPKPSPGTGEGSIRPRLLRLMPKGNWNPRAARAGRRAPPGTRTGAAAAAGRCAASRRRPRRVWRAASWATAGQGRRARPMTVARTIPRTATTSVLRTPTTHGAGDRVVAGEGDQRLPMSKPAARLEEAEAGGDVGAPKVVDSVGDDPGDAEDQRPGRATWMSDAAKSRIVEETAGCCRAVRTACTLCRTAMA